MLCPSFEFPGFCLARSTFDRYILFATFWPVSSFFGGIAFFCFRSTKQQSVSIDLFPDE
jgi:hypothetical protein